ncbi:MAG: HPr family phosphocarrier protein [Planctomycetota bacterium]|nr:MAG: HPr family phosphocarrier protein [Planctomycetota bacterium]
MERCVRIVNPRGLHARPCHAIASTALAFQSECSVASEGQEVNAKSILELMTLGAAQGAELCFRASGKDAAELLQALEKLVAGGFGEST